MIFSRNVLFDCQSVYELYIKIMRMVVDSTDILLWCFAVFLPCLATIAPWPINTTIDDWNIVY